MRINQYLVFTLLTFFTMHVSAFGGIGHKAICEIAYMELTAQSKAEVDRLLATNSESSFAQSCIWADYKRQKQKRSSDHWINVPRHYYEIRGEECRLGDVCLFTAIRQDVNRLHYEDNDSKKLESLKYLGHWVGDIHQPLHVSYKDDRGGNGIEVDSTICRYDPPRDYDYSFHAVWDGCVIRDKIGTSYKQIASTLRDEITDENRHEWLDSSTGEWADESYDISRMVKTGYCVLDVSNRCQYAAGNYRLDKTEDSKTVSIDDQYLDNALPIVRERIQKAGVRLSGLLNSIFDPEVFEQPESESE